MKTSLEKICLHSQDTIQSLGTSPDHSPSPDSDPSPSPSIKKLRLSVRFIKRAKAEYGYSAKGLASQTSFKISLVKAAVENSFREALKSIKQEEEEDKGEINPNKDEIITPIPVLDRKISLVNKDKNLETTDLFDADDRKLVVEILREKPELRFEEEVKFLQKMLEQIKFFGEVKKEVSQKVFKQIFEKLKLEEREAGQIVFAQDNIIEGNFGKKFYVILQGSVYIMLGKEGAIKEEKEESQHERRESSIDNRSLALFLKKKVDFTEQPAQEQIKELVMSPEELENMMRNEYKEKAKRKILEQAFPKLFILEKVEHGESFGDMTAPNQREKYYCIKGILNFERMKTMTVVAREKTVLGVLDYEEYQNLLGKLNQRKNSRIADFLSKMDAFEHWSYHQLSGLIQHLEEIKYPKHHVIYHEGDSPDHLYFIVNGEIEVNTPGMEPPVSAASTSQERKKLRQPLNVEKIKLALIGQGEYFGEDEIITPKPRSYSSVVQSVEVELLSISLEKFQFFVKDQDTLSRLQASAFHKRHLYESMVKNYMNVTNLYPRTSPEKPSEETVNMLHQSPFFKKKRPQTFKKEPQQQEPHQPISLFKRNLLGRALNRPKNITKIIEQQQQLSPRSIVTPSPQKTKFDFMGKSNLLSPTKNGRNTPMLFERRNKTSLKNSRLLSSSHKEERRRSTAKEKQRENSGTITMEMEIETNHDSFNFVKKGVPANNSQLSGSNNNMTRFSPDLCKNDDSIKQEPPEEAQPVENNKKQKQLRKILRISTKPTIASFQSIRTQKLKISPDMSFKHGQDVSSSQIFSPNQGQVFRPYPTFSPLNNSILTSPKRIDSIFRIESSSRQGDLDRRSPELLDKGTPRVSDSKTQPLRIGSESETERHKRRIFSSKSPRAFSTNLLLKKLDIPIKTPSYAVLSATKRGFKVN